MAGLAEFALVRADQAEGTIAQSFSRSVPKVCVPCDSIFASVLTGSNSRWMSPAALDLAERLLTFDPARRVSAQAAMEAPYFTQEQPPAERPTG